MDRKPNVLWIYTDEQRPDSLGCYGSKWARTPNIDRLAEGGTIFQECHIQSPACVPSRTSQLTCRYPQDVGVYDNKYFFKDGIIRDGVETFPALFAKEGYQTCNIGKWHTPNIETWQELNNFQHFRHTGMFGLESDAVEKENMVIKRPGGTPIILAGIYPHDRWGTTPSSHITDLSIEWLEKNQTDNPFFLRASYLWPHTPVLPPAPWHRLYDPYEIPYNLDLYSENFEKRSRFDKNLSRGQRGNELSEAEWRWIRQCYYGLCGQIDHQVGRLLHKVEEMGLLDNTIIVYTSDHGKNLGEYGCCEKSGYFSQVWKVPFIMSGPGITMGVARDDLSESIDLGPTLMAFAGIKPADGMAGRDLFHSDSPDAVYGVIECGGINDLNKPYAPENQGLRRIAVRSGKWKYDYTYSNRGARISTKEDEYDGSLFDMENDMFETRNLSAEVSCKAIADKLRKMGNIWYNKYYQERRE